MRTFNLFAFSVFGILAIVTFCCGFCNKIHFVISAICAALATFALIDNSDDESLLDFIKSLLKNDKVS